MSTYSDKYLKLNNIALTQFEMAREIPAAIDLFAKKPQTLDMQARMLILKVNAALHNLKSKNKIHGNKLDIREVKISVTHIQKPWKTS